MEELRSEELEELVEELAEAYGAPDPIPQRVRVCPQCGKHNSESAWHCSECGTTLSIETLTDAEEAPRRSAQIGARQSLEEACAAEARDEFEAALTKCDMAIQLNPGLAEAHNLRGIVLEKLGRMQEAVAAYREAARLDPDSTEARENLQELEAELKRDRDWLRRYEREAAESSAAAKLAPSELILLHGDKFASTSSVAWKPMGSEWVRLVHIDTDAEAYELGKTMLAAAFLANEQAGAVHLEVRQQDTLFDLFKRDKLYVVPGERAIPWPSYSFESQLRGIAARLQSTSGKERNHVSEIIWIWMERDSEDPWTQVGNFVYAGLVRRGLLQKERESGLKGLLAGTSYVLPSETAALAAQQSLEPIRQLLATCRRTRPEVWDLLIEGINKGIGKCTQFKDMWD